MNLSARYNSESELLDEEIIAGRNKNLMKKTKHGPSHGHTHGHGHGYEQVVIPYDEWRIANSAREQEIELQ